MGCDIAITSLASISGVKPNAANACPTAEVLPVESVATTASGFKNFVKSNQDDEQFEAHKSDKKSEHGKPKCNCRKRVSEHLLEQRRQSTCGAADGGDDGESGWRRGSESCIISD